MDVQLVLAGDPVDLGHRFVFFQPAGDFGQGVGQGLDLKVTAHRAADLLRVDDGGVLLDDPPLFQRLDAGLDRHPRDTHRLPDVGVGHPGVFDQQLNDALVQRVQTFQKHGKSPLACSFAPSIPPPGQKENCVPHLRHALGGTHFCAQSRVRNSFPLIFPWGQNLVLNRALAAKRLAHSQRQISLYVSRPYAHVVRAGRLKQLQPVDTGRRQRYNGCET